MNRNSRFTATCFPCSSVNSSTITFLLNEIYFSSLLGMQVIFPLLLPCNFFMSKCASLADRLWKYTRENFGTLSFYVATIMSRFSKFTEYVTMIMISHPILSQVLITFMTYSGFIKQLLIIFVKYHILGEFKPVIYFFDIFFRPIYKNLSSIITFIFGGKSSYMTHFGPTIL